MEEKDSIRAPHQNWLALTAIIITILGFGATTWRDVSNGKENQTKLEQKVETLTNSLDTLKDKNSTQLTNIRVDISEIKGKIDVLLERNQTVSKTAVVGFTRHLGKDKSYRLAD